ncbi:MAG: AN1-type zinc finger domain-containing protein [Candidatus Thorarchaeota archaeon]
MANCSLCGQEDLCFTCPYCNGVFCSEHRLPEGHGCAGMHLAKDAARRKISDSFSGSYETDDDFFVERKKQTQKKPKRQRRGKRFSEKEIKELVISSILVILVGISLLSQFAYGGFGIVSGVLAFIGFIMSEYWWVPVTIIVIFWGTYMVHEMAHKFTAQHYGMWSEFRMTTQGYYLSAIAILFSIPIFGTGVVYTSGAKSMEEDGKVNLAGPFSNFIIAAVLATIVIYMPIVGISLDFRLLFAIRYGVILNAMIGLFNMIPFQPFDGGTVRAWNPRIWAIQTIALVTLVIFGYFVMPIIG